MKNIGITTAFIALSTSLLLGTSYADNPVDTAILRSIDSHIQSGNASIETTLNDLFFRPLDALFPTPSANADMLNTVASSNNLASELTSDTINNQLKVIPSTISVAYQNLALSRSLAQATAPQNPMKDELTKLTLDKPSYDTLYLPENTCNFDDDRCLAQQKPDVLSKNAQNFSFDGFFAPTSNAPNYDADGKVVPSTAQNYISYALQTYQPLIETSTSYGDGSQGQGTQNQTFFQALNDKLGGMKKSEANSYLVNHVLQTSTFQKYWIALRTLEAKNSVLLSNFNYLAAERTPQKGLGSAYNLPNADASPVQVEQALVNNTVYNPDWYKQMKTAAPVTLQREQLLLTSLLVRLQYHNQQINERNLATQLIIANSMIEQGKTGLQQQEAQLKNLLKDD